MIDNQGAQAAVGNIFDFVLIASERIREINRERYNNGTYSADMDVYRHLEKPHQQAVREMVEGKVGREYLKKLGRKTQKSKHIMR